MGVEFGLHLLSKGRALVFFGFFQSMTRAVLGGLLILLSPFERLTGFAEFYDVVVAQLTEARS